MTKLRDLERHLRRNGCERLRHGASHAVWYNPGTGSKSAVPRHVEIPPTTARAICRQLDVPDVTR